MSRGAETTDEYVDRLYSTWPRLTNEQVDTIATLISRGGGSQ